MTDKINARPAGATPAVAAKPMLIGRQSSGPEVVAIQTQLKALKLYAAEPDGQFGSKTEAAVIAFQTSKGIKPDGIVGPDTRAALAAAVTAKPAKPATPADGNKVSDKATEKAAEKDVNKDIMTYPAEKTEPQSRLEEQKESANNLLSSLAAEAQVAVIAYNPIFMPAALAISAKANARAVVRYETETPQKDFGVLLNEESSKARKEILGLPAMYAEFGSSAINAVAETSTALALKAYEYGSAAVASVAENGGRLLDSAVEGTKKAAKVWWFLETAPVRWLGSAAKWLGGVLSGGGSSMENVGK